MCIRPLLGGSLVTVDNGRLSPAECPSLGGLIHLPGTTASITKGMTTLSIIPLKSLLIMDLFQLAVLSRGLSRND